MHGHENKADRYIALLDTARVEGSWSELPELIRKVNKHASGRKTLISTATAELQIANTSSSRPATANPGSNPFTALSNAVHAGNNHDGEDTVQGRACLLWARWVGMIPQSAPQISSPNIFDLLQNAYGKTGTTWTKICMVKSAYIAGTQNMLDGQTPEARGIFTSAVDMMQTNRDLILSTPQFAYWSEQLLAQFSLLLARTGAVSGSHDATRAEVLRHWSLIAAKTKEVSPGVYGNSSAHTSRMSVWRSYYEYLSSILVSSTTSASRDETVRLQLSTELRKAERACENELLRTVKFPQATDSNKKVEGWVEQIIGNWQILCGPQWRDSELGEGGRNAVARNVLDMLYRAATKTFHSTLILRRLFQVHKSLTEFDLAYKALDTYIELVERANERAAKSGKSHSEQEPFEAVLATVSEGVEGLCSFGRQAEARKAYELCSKLSLWADPPDVDDNSSFHPDQSQSSGQDHVQHRDLSLSPEICEVVYRAIGIGKAHWARWTPFSEHRARLQEEALQSLKLACSQHSSSQTQVETLYATALVLAETRDITQAIDFVKQALAKGTSSDSGTSQWATERKAVSSWHLLALLLSSRGDYDNGAKSCTAAFEQFPSTAVLLGHADRSSSISASSEKHVESSTVALIDDMECHELQRIIEIRITELALTELTEGPEEAVNCSNELLSLFSQIFAHLQISSDASITTRSLEPPKSSAGTVRSTRGSMFGRQKYAPSVDTVTEKPKNIASSASTATRPSTRATQAPTIQITDEEGKSPTHKRHLFRGSHENSTHESRTSLDGSIRKLAHHHSLHSHRNDRNQTTETANPSGTVHDATTIPNDDVNVIHEQTMQNLNLAEPILPLEHEKSTEARQELPEIGHNLGPNTTVPPPIAHDSQPPQQDVRLPTVHSFTNSTSPAPRFSKSAAQKHALTVLTKIWLVIATLYRRASMFDDSREACEEAAKAASKIEGIVGASDQSARAFASPGWGSGGKSVDEIWADVYCERAELQSAIHIRRVKERQETESEGLRTAVELYEQCLMYLPDHIGGVIGLSNILLDYYEKKVDLGKRVNDGHAKGTEIKTNVISERRSTDGVIGFESQNGSATAPRHSFAPTEEMSRTEDDLKKSPENLNRIAARDRAYGLLSSLTKMGNGYDNSEAWFALARAHELGGEINKAKSILWWCIELEDTKPIRHWRNLGYSI